MISNLSIDDIPVDVMYTKSAVAWKAVVNGRQIGEMITIQDDGELVQRIAEAIFAERQKSDDIEPVTS